jgi:hypothetical protein
LYAFDSATSSTSAHLAQVLIDPGRRTVETSFELVGSAVASRIAAYSSWKVANCCPDLHYRATWGWQDGHYVASPAKAVGPIPLTISVSADPTAAHAGQIVTYTVKITNGGTQRITSAWWWVALSSTNDHPSRCATLCQLGDLAPGAPAKLSFTIKMTDTDKPLTATVGVNGVLPSGTIHADGRALVHS